MEEMECELDESQTLKLKLVEERKKHENTKQELLEVKSSRNSMVFSDSGCDADDAVENEEREVVDYLVRELENERKKRQEAELAKISKEKQLLNLMRKREHVGWDRWKYSPQVRSVDYLNCLSGHRDENVLRRRNKSASLNSLNNQGSDGGAAPQGLGLQKWYSVDEMDEQVQDDTYSEASSQEDERERMKQLTEKVANLERELVREKTIREVSEKTVAKLHFEKEELYEELDETRYQLHMSQLDLTFDEEGYEEELLFEKKEEEEEEEVEEYEENCAAGIQSPHGQEKCVKPGNQWTNNRGQSPNSFAEFPRNRELPSIRQLDSPIGQVSSSSSGTQSPNREHYSLSDLRLSNQLRNQTSGIKPMTGSWVNMNVQHYELDDYDFELDVEQEKTPLSFMETLRRLRMHTSSLYNEAVSEGKELRLLRDRVSRVYTPPKIKLPNRRRHSISFF